jgi:hypothetical protein
MRTPVLLAPVLLWIARLIWMLLPLTAGVAASDALDGWSTTPGTLAAAYLWLAWAVGLVALLAPRPLGLTALRAIAPTFLALAIVVAVGDSAGSASKFAAVATTALAAACALAPPVSVAAANGAAYGDERRFPLKIPPVLFLGPLPLAPLVITAGVATGPLLLSDGRIALGIVALLGFPLAALAARSLHTLAQRFAVLVPAGIAIVDPFTLSDPVLFPRERITSLHAVDPRTRPPEGALDVRVGAVGGSLAVTLDKTTDALQIRRGRRGSETVKTNELWFAAGASRELVQAAGARKIKSR